MSDSSATRHTAATPAQIWAVVSNGYRYAEWVKGTREIRAVDDSWPDVNSAIHFTVGLGPITHKDKTIVRACEQQRLLELEVQAWPLGTARVGLRIEPTDGGSTVTLDEHPLRGPAGLFRNPLTSLGFLVRTKLMIKDLVRLAEAEPRP
jgi:Polyketide cyclase / dehydrase and lipid transport